jgi:tRNA (guanine37-N1)-methyltransferase
MPLRIDILTLFPDMFGPVLGASIVGRACESGIVHVHVHDIRAWADGPHRKVDDRPFGGGPGMVLMCEPLAAAIEAVEAMDPRPATRILLAPAGERLTQAGAERLAQPEGRIMLVCGHYEGVDERAIVALRLHELSIGDVVLSGGEIPAMLVTDSVVRLLPGALGHGDSAAQDSFSITDPQGHPLLDCPHYTRPREWRGMAIPEPLLSGDHGAIAQWRLEQSVSRTRERRPDLLHERPLDRDGSKSQASDGLPHRAACCTGQRSRVA